ncbi:aldo/keto reductase [Lentinula guzmanii]|uniref:Aldo/keto reductase n=1 Tax=Lentinula guzmanii TaxID=2804957 RepID=A0AA38N0L3_9AGAR|nr:aldo/keto reductase [Lentinula guzmanii]
MPGHVNMMDDVLISQLPPDILKSSLRALVSQNASSQKVFVEHVRILLRASLPAYPSPSELFGSRPCYTQFLASIRCLFTSKMAIESLPYFTHFMSCIPLAQTQWQPNDKLESALEEACGDIVQAIQALKELRSTPTEELRECLLSLNSSIKNCDAYSVSNNLQFPFVRAQLQVDDALHLIFPDARLHHYPIDHGLKLNKRGVNPDIATYANLEHVELGPLKVPRIFNGLWQLSSPAWGTASIYKQHVDFEQLIRIGFVATDMADHYGDAELVYGSFRNQLPLEIGANVIACSKWCVFGPPAKPVTPDFVMEAVLERSRRLGGRVELLQFHWYDYEAKDYLRTLVELVKITKSHPHLVTAIGLCNFDSHHTEEACQYLLREINEVGIVSNQIQYSLIDSRPTIKMEAVCQKYGVKLLTYGSFLILFLKRPYQCGGFFSDKWLDADAPNIYSEKAQLTPSQRKYFDMINNWGSWDDFHALLRTLKRIAIKHNVDLANVAARWVLNRPSVGAVIAGTRAGISNNSESNLKTFSFTLDAEDTNQLDEYALGDRAQMLYNKIGDCGSEYRQ